MLKQHFFIDNYNWEVYIFYYVESIHRRELFEFVDGLGYNIILDINLIAGVLNGGFCYTNYNDRCSIILVNITENFELMCNTIVHELNHLSSHIEEYYRIDSHSEKACYLIGELALQVSHFLNYILF